MMMQDVSSVSNTDAYTTLISDVTAWTWERRASNEATTQKICAKGGSIYRKCIQRGSLVFHVMLLYLTGCSHEYDTQVVGTLPAKLALVVAQWHIGAMVQCTPTSRLVCALTNWLVCIVFNYNRFPPNLNLAETNCYAVMLLYSKMFA